MTAVIAGTELYYEMAEGSGVPIVLLHGWGGSHVSFAGLFGQLKRAGRTVVSLDFPGFGASSPPGRNWGIYDYAVVTAAFIDALHLDGVLLVGHSFGGRVAIILAKLPFVRGVVLADSAGMRPRRGPRYYLKVGAYKLAKRLGRGAGAGSADYRVLDETMRPVFVRVVNTFLERELPRIHCPVLIVWGRDDRDTPPYMAERLKKGIRDSDIVYLPGGHYSYLDSAAAFYRILTAFAEETEKTVCK